MSEKRFAGKGFVAAAVVLSFLVGILIPSPIFYIVSRLGGPRIFMVRDAVEMVTPDGRVYEGTVNAFTGRYDGYGLLKSADTSYFGKWRDGRLLFGSMTTGQMSYRGKFDSRLRRDGFGILDYAASRIDSLRAAGVPDSAIVTRYSGNWHDDLPEGLGGAVMADSAIVFGMFRNGTPVPVPGARYRIGDKVYGIDVSHFQGRISWDHLALFCDSLGSVYYDEPAQRSYMQPVFFVFIKATEGSDFVDNTFKTHMIEAQRHGIARGAYHFLRLSGRVEDQIDNFTGTAYWQPGDLPPVLDLEVESEIIAFGSDESRDFIYSWLKGVEERMGVRPLIYTTDRIRDTYLKADERFDRFGYWIARYDRSMPLNTDWIFWQFSGKGMISGCDSQTDLDIYHGNLASFRNRLRSN